MMEGTAVIGAAFGDEGKGLLTDALAARLDDPIVVRFNGGAQAGHTVVAPDGRRHVFSHVGSGAFAGARTFLSRYFVANPLLFGAELAKLRALRVDERALTPLVDARALVTTPYDMLINQIAERARGARRHGSVGIGFGETIERGLEPRFALTAGELAGDERRVRAHLRALLDRVRTEWVPRRLAALGLAEPSDEPFASALAGNELPARWIDDALAFGRAVELRADASCLRAAAARGAVVFEGAQGLLLDQDRGWFPFVTRSNTGLKNVLAIAREAGLDRLDVIYAHRAYATRHGAGPLPHELDGPPYPAIRDETNRPNAYQGTLRFALPDLDLIAATVRDDLSDADGDGRPVLTTALAVTCLDQTGETVRFVADGEQRALEQPAFLAEALRRTGLGRLIAVRGRTRDDVAPLRPHALCMA